MLKEDEQLEEEKYERLRNKTLLMSLINVLFGLIVLQSLPILYGSILDEGSDVMNFITNMVYIYLVVGVLGVIGVTLSKLSDKRKGNN